jgi:hypothetical protein
MNKTIFSALSILGLATILFSSSSCNTKPQDSDTKVVEIKADLSKTDSAAVKAKAYVCPMGPQCGQSDSAGKCTSCGMEMKKDPNYHQK